jgi:hypothetical protein
MRQVLCASLMALCFANPAFSTEKTMLIDQIPIDTQTFAPSNGATVEQFPDQKASLQKDVHAFLEGKYEVTSERFLVLQSRGALIVSGINDYVSNELHGKETLTKTLPSMASITLWKKGHEYFAVALSPVLPDGNTMYDLIELKKE